MLLFAIGHINRDYTIPSIIFKALYSFKLCKIIRSFVSLVKNFYFISFLFLYPSVFLLFITSRSSILSEVKFLLILILCQEILTIVFHHVFQLFLCVFPMLLRKANKVIFLHLYLSILSDFIFTAVLLTIYYNFSSLILSSMVMITLCNDSNKFVLKRYGLPEGRVVSMTKN